MEKNDLNDIAELFASSATVIMTKAVKKGADPEEAVSYLMMLLKLLKPSVSKDLSAAIHNQLAIDADQGTKYGLTSLAAIIDLVVIAQGMKEGN